MRALVLALLLALTTWACSPGEIGRIDNPEIDWWYAHGPNGERCLFSRGGAGDAVWTGMDCDEVRFPSN